MRSDRSKPAQEETKLRIVTQYREKSSMIYEMECAGAQLDIRISPASLQGDGAAEWRIEARPGRSSDAGCVMQSAASRSDALREVARQWIARAPEQGLPSFDWDAVTRVLESVRAI